MSLCSFVLVFVSCLPFLILSCSPRVRFVVLVLPSWVPLLFLACCLVDVCVLLPPDVCMGLSVAKEKIAIVSVVCHGWVVHMSCLLS